MPVERPALGDARVARGALWNLVGLLSPIVLAVATVPFLIANLGLDRFGFLTLAWLVMAYLGLFDFGLSRATTRAVAQLREGGHDGLARLAWTSFLAHVALGAAGGMLLAGLAPWLTDSVLNIPRTLAAEARGALMLLAVSVPLVVSAGALRGILEGSNRFDLANFGKTAHHAGAYLMPMAVSFWTADLRVVVGAVVVSRVLVLALHLGLCSSVVPFSWSGARFDAEVLKPLLPFGGWLTVSSLVAPIVVTFDRMAIGARVSLEAVAYYATPYEIVSKLYIVPASLLGAAFPALSAAALHSRGEVRALYGRLLNALVVAAVPLGGLVLLLASDGLTLWLGAPFAKASAPVARVLCLGVVVSLAGGAPLTLLQAGGRAGVVARIQLLQLPWYAWAVWHLAPVAGVVAVAAAWSLKASIESLLLCYAAERVEPGTTGLSLRRSFIAGAFLAACWTAGMPSLAVAGAARGLGLLLVALFVAWEWRELLEPETRALVQGWVRSSLKARAGGTK